MTDEQLQRLWDAINARVLDEGGVLHKDSFVEEVRRHLAPPAPSADYPYGLCAQATTNRLMSWEDYDYSMAMAAHDRRLRYLA